MKSFETINHGYAHTFHPNRLSIGMVVPIEQYATGPVPAMKDHLKRVQLVEQLGFKALWIRDIPFNVPSFGDAGQTFAPFTYLGYLAAQTTEIGLGIASIALPLNHPLRVAESAATVDQLSDGRLIMGIASGDRATEYPGMGIEYENRGELFRKAFAYLRKAAEHFPVMPAGPYGELNGMMDILPKPTAHKLPLLMTGYSRQTLEWNAEHADGWMSYPKPLMHQKITIDAWREQVAGFGEYDKPFMQPLYVILEENDDARPRQIPLGFRIGAKYLVEYLHKLEAIGVNHVAFNLRFNERDMEQTLAHLGEKVLPHFHSTTNASITS